jgi:hypothetical protein
MHDDDLTPEERAAFASLPRERDPGEMLEERTVRALRARGLIGRHEVEPRGFVLTPAWMTAAAAVLVAVFTGGFALGQWIQSRESSKTLVELRRQDAAHAAAVVQQTGSAYLAALSALTDASRQSNGNANAAAVAQGREVATTILHAAANEMVRLNPEDPLTQQILAGLDRAARNDSLGAAGTGADTKRQVAWF